MKEVLHEQHFEEYIHSLSSSLANCERIVKQPIPLGYSRHTSRFLTFYLLSFPLTLVPMLGWLTVPVMMFISWSFISILEIGHFIEEPFNKEFQIIPFTKLITIVRNDISEILDEVVKTPRLEEFDEKLLNSSKNQIYYK